MEGALNEPAQIYERLRNAAICAFERNEVEVDPQLADPARDLRRGLTLALRPGRAVQAAIGQFQQVLAAAAPGQYFYRPEELHVTVLAVIPGTRSWRKPMRQLAAYESVIAEVLGRHRRFSIAFRGATASPAAVMVQGFPGDGTLGRIRDDLREALHRHRLGDQLDARYKIQTAHVTVMRFKKALADGNRLAELLQSSRTTDFGELQATAVELIWGDWYASATIARTIRTYPLQS